jgi:2-dehydro-3-deoxy-D-arabinonate dehydratase
MKLCRFATPEGDPHIGLLGNGHVHDLTASGRTEFTNWASLLVASARTPISALVGAVDEASLPLYPFAELDMDPEAGAPHLLPPVDRQEVWAAGVTYAWSREARTRESQSREVYVKVYDAPRPELFFKAIAEKVVGPNDWIGLRDDSHWNVPEPELALVINPALQIVGVTIGNDVSSRDIEGENPLYLPQAKIYKHSCALGPLMTVAGAPLDPRNLAVRLTVHRAGAPAFRGETSTAKIHRTLEELVDYLGRNNEFPYGAILLTGTGIVPGDDFSLRAGDEVEIEIEGIGVLRNSVRQI